MMLSGADPLQTFTAFGALRAAVVTAVVVALVPLSLNAAPPAPPFVLDRGVVVDATRGIAFTAKPGDAVGAIDVTTGREVWTSTDAALPIGADTQFVTAQLAATTGSTDLKVAVLDAASGRTISFARVALPAGARPLVSDEAGKAFRAAVEREGANLFVSWYYVDAGDDGDDADGPRFFAGAVRFSPQDGHVINSSGGQVNAVPANLNAYGAPPRPPWHAGNVTANAEGGRGGPLVLKRTDNRTGAALRDVVVSNQALFAMSAGDQLNVVASERIAGSTQFRWRVFATDTASEIGTFARGVSATPFFVSGDNVVLVSIPHSYLSGSVLVSEPLELQAVRASDGLLQWRVELRDLSRPTATTPHRRSKR
jgi:hypothetical protein